VRAIRRIDWIAVAAVCVGVGIAVFTFIPSSFWRHPYRDEVYRGFDPNLVSINRWGYQVSEPGLIQIKPESLSLATVSSSNPSVHLLTTPLRFVDVTSDISISESSLGTTPLRLDVWNPLAKSAYRLSFEPAPSNQIVSQMIVDGSPSQTLQGGKVISAEILGNYSPGSTYHFKLEWSRPQGLMVIHVTGNEDSPNHHSMLQVAGGPSDPAYGDVLSEPFPVVRNAAYTFGGLVRLISGSDAYKVNIAWLDSKKNIIGFANDWQSVRLLNGWTKLSFSGVAPTKAAFGRLQLGAGNGTLVRFSDLFVEASTSPKNLLSNPSLLSGRKGWSPFDELSRQPVLIEPHAVAYTSTVSAEHAAALFKGLSFTLTASANSIDGTSRASLTNYSLTLFHQKFWVDKTDDPVALVTSWFLMVLSSLLIIAGVARSLARASLASRRRIRVAQPVPALRRMLAVPTGAVVVGIVLGLLVVLPNLFLFRMGMEPFDMSAQKIWAYIATSFPPSHLYYLPNTISLGYVWGGTPYYEAVYPYEPVFGHLFSAIGFIDRTILFDTGSPVESSQLAVLIKLSNLVFLVAGGVLIYLILRRVGMGTRSSQIGAALYLFNPAVWFSSSVLGLTHVVSVALLLSALLMLERGHSTAAWIMLAIAAVSRPQMLVIGVIVAVVLLRRFAWRRTLVGIAWSVIALFMLFAPYELGTAPSLPVDVMAHTINVQAGGGNERALTTVSLNAYTLWPLVTKFVSGQVGQDRIFYPSANPLMLGLTYQQAGQVLTGFVALLLCAVLLLRRRAMRLPGSYLPALAGVTVGFLVFTTGIGAAHYVLALPLIIICRRWLEASTHSLLVLAWSVSALVPMFGSMSFALSQADNLRSLPLSMSNPLARAFVSLSSADSIITFGCVSSVVVLLALIATSTLGVRDQRSVDSPRQSSRDFDASESQGRVALPVNAVD
jgi:hypothetical protein